MAALRVCSRPIGRILRPNCIITVPKSRSFAISSPRCQDGAPRTTHFGFETVTETEKTERVAGVFTSVAESYDRMNDLMSFGWHRVWKSVTLYALTSPRPPANASAETTSSPPSPRASPPPNQHSPCASSTSPAGQATSPSATSTTRTS
jgi:hypothetical protein